MEKLNAGIDFELFRSLLESNLQKLTKAPDGRPPYDYVQIFKILILHRYYNLSDEQVEYQINERMSFMRFLDLSISDDIPDSPTVWVFLEQLINFELVEKLFDLFLVQLKKLNLIVNQGKIIDASFIEVPKQRNTKADNDTIKAGEIPTSISEKPHRKAQKRHRCTLGQKE